MSSKNALSQDILDERLAWSLDRKIQETWERIAEWVTAWGQETSVSFSGGLDSTALLDLVRTNPLVDGRLIPAYFADTGTEFPEIRRFVKSVSGITWVVPEKRFHHVVKEYGYPVVSKKMSQYIGEVQKAKTSQIVRLRLTGWRKNGTHSPISMIAHKWHFLVGAPFKISDKCCHCLKKVPLKKMGIPMVGVRAAEGSNRASTYIRTGCNAFDQKCPRSWPIAFWTDSDIKEYIAARKLPYSEIYNMGYTRTGCFPCPIGVHLEPWPNRFQMMEKTHPRLWDLSMDRFGLQRVFEWMNEHLAASQRISFRYRDYEKTIRKDAKQMSFDFVRQVA